MLDASILESVDSAALALCLLESSNDALFLFHPHNLKIVDANPSAEKITRFTRKRILQLSIRGLIHAEDTQLMNELLTTCQTTCSLLSTHTYNLLGDQDQYVPVNISVSRLKCKPDALGILAVRDISQQQQIEAELRTTQQMLAVAQQKRTVILQAPHEKRDPSDRVSELVNDVNAIVWEAELPCRRFTYVSQHAETILGYLPTQWVEESDFWECHLHKDDVQRVFEYSQKRTDRGMDHVVDYRFIAADRKVVWLHDVVHVMKDDEGQAVKLRGVMLDITARMEQEEALRNSESRYRALVENAPVCIHEIDTQGRLLSINAAGLKMIEKTNAASVIGQPYLDIVVESDRERVRSHLQAAMDGKSSSFELTGCIHGKQRIFTSAVAPLRQEDGTIIRLMGVSQEITEQKAVELALRESEAKFRVLSENSPATVFIAQSEKFVYCNPAVVSLSGYSTDEFLRLKLSDIVHGDHADLVLKRHRSRLQGEPVPSRYEIKFVMKNGESRWLDISVEAINFEGAPAVLVVGVDVSERKQAEERLRRREEQLAHVSRLSTMGEMVAEIAHEINQPLTAISNFAAACNKTIEKMQYEFEAPMESWLEHISQQAVRCGDIIRRLQRFVTRNDNQWFLVDVNHIVRDSIALVGSDISHQTTIRFDLPEHGPRVNASEVQLQQVMVNLLRNACQATQAIAAPEIRIQVETVDEHARIVVGDNGPGISESQRDKLFEAFYTTKADGMGMGLAISKTIIEAHCGHLRFDPASDSGARFIIELPLPKSGSEQ